MCKMFKNKETKTKTCKWKHKQDAFGFMESKGEVSALKWEACFVVYTSLNEVVCTRFWYNPKVTFPFDKDYLVNSINVSHIIPRICSS